MFIIGNINFFIFSIEDSHQCGELLFGSAGKIPVYKGIICLLLEQIPGNQTAGIDKVGFEVGMFCNFFIIEGRRGKDIQIFQTTALQ